MEKITQNAIWRRAEGISAIYADCAKDFILPDSYPDIRKILYTAATICPEQSNVDNGRFSAGGNLVCKVLFSDEEGALHTVSFTLEYSASTTLKDSADEAEASVSAEEILQGVTTRALNPRKLALKGKIKIIPHVYFVTEASPEIDSNIPEASIERLSEYFTYWEISHISERSLEASEDLNLPGDQPLQEIIFANLNMGTPSCEAVGGSIRFTGEGRLELLYRTTDGVLRFAELPIPFHSSIDADVTPDALCIVKLSPETLSCLPAEDATGEAHSIELDFSYTVSAWIAMPAECARVSDCYSTACPTETREGSATAVSALRKLQKQQRRMLTCPSEGMKKCMKAFATVYPDSIERAEGGLIAHCIAELTLVGNDEEGAPMTLSLTEAFPWELEEADEASLFLSAEADPVVEAEEIKLSLTVNAELLAWQNSELSFVTALEALPEEDERRRTSLTLCYPMAGERLWEIAKRYRMPQSRIIAANTISEGALPKVLLIPAERKAIFSKMI